MGEQPPGFGVHGAVRRMLTHDDVLVAYDPESPERYLVDHAPRNRR